MEYLKKQHMICFSLLEFKKIYKDSCITDIKIAMKELGIDSYIFDDEKRNKVLNHVARKRLKNKEDIELFIALTSAVAFYGNDSKICFDVRRGYIFGKEEIETIYDLKKVLEEKSSTDFGIYKDRLRRFQLKQCRIELSTDSIFGYIKKVLGKYGNNLGDVDLLIQLQGPEGGKLRQDDDVKITYNNIDFQEINKRLIDLELRYDSRILIKYNEMNKNSVKVQLYPIVEITKEPIDDNFLAGEILYN